MAPIRFQMKQSLCVKICCHLGFFFELSAARSFLCPLSMKYTLASRKQALPSISASGIKRRISFGISVGIGFVRVSFIQFPLPAGKRHNRVIGYTAPDGGGTRERAGGAVVGCLTLPPPGREGAVPLCRRQTGNGLSLAPAARNVRAAVCFLGGGRFRPASPPAAASGRTVSCASARRLRRRPSFCRTVRRRGNDSFSKLS